MYGVTYMDWTNGRNYVSFYSNTEEEINRLWNVDPNFSGNFNVYGIRAGAMCEDGYYGYLVRMYTGYPEQPDAFVKVDFQTQKIDTLNVYPEISEKWEWIYDMTYDPTNKKAYGIGRLLTDKNEAFSSLYTVDITNGGLTKVADLDFYAWALASDYEGNLYATRGIPNAQGEYYQVELVKLNANNGYKAEKVVTLTYYGADIKPILYHSMEFDHSTGDLWYLFNNANSSRKLMKINVKTGEYKVTRSLAYDLIVGLTIPYEKADSREAAGRITDLTCVPGENGKVEATLKWTNPAINWKGDKLTELKSIKISRGTRDNVIATVNATGVGKAQTWVDNTAKNGYNTYYLTTYRKDNEKGLTDSITAFIGVDVPGMPTDVVLTATGTTGTVTWKAPEVGKNGAWIDKASLKYRVVRYPGKITVAEATTETSFTEKCEERQSYSYEITAFNNAGESEPAVSNVLPFGEGFAIPYTNDIRTLEDFNLWTSIDVNGDADDEGAEWRWQPEDDKAIYNGGFCNNKANDYLMSPPLMLKKGKKYLVRFKYQSSSWIDTKESWEIGVSQTVDPALISEKFKKVYERDNIHTIQYVYDDECIFTSDFDGEGYVGFHVTSDPMMGWITVRNFSIREYTDKDIMVKDVTGNTLVNQDKETTVNVTVYNSGSAAVQDYKVKLINQETGEVIEEMSGLPLEPKQTELIPVLWTPTEQQQIKITAEVELEGDAYPLDNKTDRFIDVKVQETDALDWISLYSRKDNNGWTVPFFMHFNYNQNQVLYLARELQSKKNIQLTGMQLVYVGKPGGDVLIDIPVRISLMNSQKTKLDPTKDFMTTGWTNVFDKEICVDQVGDACTVELMFDKAFDYNGENLMVNFEKRPGRVRANDDNHPSWWFYDNRKGENRVLCYRSSSEGDIDLEAVGVYEFLPFVRFSYKEAGTSGIKTISTLDVPAQLIGHTIYLQKTCDRAELISTSGAVVARVENAAEMNVANVANGIYLLHITSEGKEATVKMIIK
ncbi:T9SS type A sorting domain-containing protein [Prevotella sp. HUN102]|uniref:T9SS type A sorting domain-containing protein n=1 Tax=Prevotella sp. HUN102 TaxID=1392486 RepID=UPI00048EB4A9|nr:T9SS type A sorting domain-containing protein [Prevotella sp. HUN102]